jgi:hypothetical protein
VNGAPSTVAQCRPTSQPTLGFYRVVSALWLESIASYFAAAATDLLTTPKS